MSSSWVPTRPVDPRRRPQSDLPDARSTTGEQQRSPYALTSSVMRSRPRPARRDSTSPRRARVPPGQRAQLARDTSWRSPADNRIRHHSVEPVGHLFETVSGADAVKGFPQFVFRCRRLGKPKVVGDRSIEALWGTTTICARNDDNVASVRHTPPSVTDPSVGS